MPKVQITHHILQPIQTRGLFPLQSMEISNKITWNVGNAKLPKRIIHLSLPSGHTCPAADKCLSRAHMITGKITDGPNTEFRCYAASMEAVYKHLRNQRWGNLIKLKNQSRKKTFQLLSASLKRKHDDYINDHGQRPIIRAHVGGDFFNKSYFLAWMDLARAFAPTWFYAYTKRLDLWTTLTDEIPSNFELNASYGGKYDQLIDRYDLKSARVVYSPEEADKLGLEIDQDDSHAYKRGPSFAQLIHGTQPAGSCASKALTKLKDHGWTGYNKRSKSMQKAY